MAAYDGVKAYCMTHRARAYLTARWAQQHRGLYFLSVYPGWVETPGLASAEQMSRFYSTFKSSLRTADEGADSIVWAAAHTLGSLPPLGGYAWDRKERSLDLSFAGAACEDGEVETIAAFCMAAAETAGVKP